MTSLLGQWARSVRGSLADLGAEVIHVEFPRARWADVAEEPESRFTPELIKTSRADQLFLHCNGGKSSLAVNLKDARGVQLIWDLIPHIDIVVENMTPRVMQGLGLSYTTLSEINPSLLMCSLTGFGQQGLDGDLGRPCSDPTAQAMSGLNWATGEREPGPPYAIGGGIGDPITSVTGVMGILAALVGRHTTGKGQHIDISMVESNLFVDCVVLPPVVMAGSAEGAPYRNGQQNSFTFPMGPFKCTGGYLSIQAAGSGEGSPWARLCGLMGREDMVTDERFDSDAARLDQPRRGDRDGGRLALLPREPREGPGVAGGGAYQRRPRALARGDVDALVLQAAGDIRQGALSWARGRRGGRAALQVLRCRRIRARSSAGDGRAHPRESSHGSST